MNCYIRPNFVSTLCMQRNTTYVYLCCREKHVIQELIAHTDTCNSEYSKEAKLWFSSNALAAYALTTSFPPPAHQRTERAPCGHCTGAARRRASRFPSRVSASASTGTQGLVGSARCWGASGERNSMNSRAVRGSWSRPPQRQWHAHEACQLYWRFATPLYFQTGCTVFYRYVNSMSNAFTWRPLFRSEPPPPQ